MKHLREDIIADMTETATVPRLLDAWRRARTGEGGGQDTDSSPARRRKHVSWADAIGQQAREIRGAA